MSQVNLTLPRVAPQPKLLWIWTDGGEASCLWPESRLSDLEISDPSWVPRMSEEFFNAVLGASERLWIMDPYFEGKVGLASIWLALTQVQLNEIRVISHEDRPKKWIDARMEMEPHKVEILWKKGFYELHDRFAIVDDEVWHFGSTVGGGYYRFSAVSRGWSSAELDIVFRNRWENP